MTSPRDESSAALVTGGHPALAGPLAAEEHLRELPLPRRSCSAHDFGYGIHLLDRLGHVIGLWEANRCFERGRHDSDARHAGEVDLVAALSVVHQLVRGGIDDLELRLIEAARARGVTWAALAPALGVADRRSAHAAYLRLLDRAPGELDL